MRKIKIDLVTLIEKYKETGSLMDTAHYFNVSEETVRRRLKECLINRLPRGSKPGELNHQYKGGTSIRSDGYEVRRGSREKPLEHRVIAERALGRKLNKGEVVHHINCDRSDNRPENLLICTQAYHMQLHSKMNKHPYWKQFGKRKQKESAK